MECYTRRATKDEPGEWVVGYADTVVTYCQTEEGAAVIAHCVDVNRLGKKRDDARLRRLIRKWERTDEARASQRPALGLAAYKRSAQS